VTVVPSAWLAEDLDVLTAQLLQAADTCRCIRQHILLWLMLYIWQFAGRCSCHWSLLC
jgi:hypothetical protein